MNDVQNKKVLIVGCARSGLAAARLLVGRGALVMANDIKPESELKQEAAQLRSLGVMLSLGSHPESLFTNADLIVLSPGVPADIAPIEAARKAGIEIVSEPELAGRFLRGRMIGITGSNGKTTTTTLVGELMRAAGADVIVGGNIGLPLTSLVERSSGGSWTVAELSSFQLETIESLRVNIAVVTNLTPDHLDRHGSFENYARAKQRIFLNQTESDWAVLNGLDSGVADMVSGFDLKSKKVYFSSRGSELPAGGRADVYVRDGRIYTTLLSGDRSESEVIGLDAISLPGMHNVENIMAALAATFCAMGTRGAGLAVLREAIKRFRGVEHRIEYVAEIEGVRFFNDSKATNVDSTIKSLEAFERNLIVILGGKDKDSDYTLLGPLVAERVKCVILIGAASDKIARQLDGLSRMIRASSMEDAVIKAMDAAAPGDTVLLAPACASFDMFDNYEHRGRVFKDEVYKLANRLHSGWTGRLIS